ncbi:MAG: energy transducer TonB [Deltaproteobacteria bacterium]|nr:energy transducer TonB [Deltaproteobacteria bacterium]
MSSVPSLAQTDALHPAWYMYGERARRKSRNWAVFGMFGMAALVCGILSEYHPRTISVAPLVRQEVMVMETYELPVPEPVQENRQEEPAPAVKKKTAPAPPPVEKKKKALSPPKSPKSMLQPKKMVAVKSRHVVADAVSSEGTAKSIPVQKPASQAVPAAGDAERAAAGKSALQKPSGQAVPAAAGNVQADAERNKVLARVLQAVERYKKYPRAGRLAGAEGRLVLTVKIGADGKVASCSVTSFSGKSVLDAAGEQLGKKLTGLNVGAKNPMTIVVPVHYRLTDD